MDNARLVYANQIRKFRHRDPMVAMTADPLRNSGIHACGRRSWRTSCGRAGSRRPGAPGRGLASVGDGRGLTPLAMRMPPLLAAFCNGCFGALGDRLRAASRPSARWAPRSCGSLFAPGGARRGRI
jgi:hypothetical protein